MSNGVTEAIRRFYPRKVVHIEDITQGRSVETFEQMPPQTQEVYMVLKGFYPDQELYACGSRVVGDMIESWDGPERKLERERAQKTPKDVSDFDYWVQPWVATPEGIPDHFDRVQIHPREKVLIPERIVPNVG